MIYILIMLFQSSGYGTPTTVVAEFHTIEACQNASRALAGQVRDKPSMKNEIAMVCAAKGLKP